MSSWKRSPRCWALLARMVFWRGVLPLLTRMLSLERMVRLLARPDGGERWTKPELAVRAAQRLWRKADAPCLERSLALYRELGRLGDKPSLVCGMVRGRDGLIGHAWVEVAGTALLDLDDPRESYGTLLVFDSEGQREPSG